MMDFKEGEVLYFDKPLGWTSFKVVGHVRYTPLPTPGREEAESGSCG